MISSCIYELIRVEIIEKLDRNTIECRQMPSGYFDNIVMLHNFIKKHEHRNNVFFIVKAWVFNPDHYGQTHDNVYECTLTADAETICKNDTHHFVVNYNELNSKEATNFKGRDDSKFKKGDITWFYDSHQHMLCRCKVWSPPITKEEAKNYDKLEWYDDSYLVHPYPLVKNDNHQHILSCMIFSDEYVKTLLQHSSDI